MAKKTTADPGAQKWIECIAVYEREFKTWQGRVEKILKRYRDEQRLSTRDSGARFNILWSNVQTARPAVFSRLPQPDVSRRFRDSDPVGRVAALLLERALQFEVEHYPDYRFAMRASVDDRFLGGRGTSWVRYEPKFKAGEQITEDKTARTQEELDYECAPCDYVAWKDFGHTVARTWEEVTAVWRRVYMGRPELVERFGDDWGNKIPLDTKPEDSKKAAGADVEYQALIYEIWDKSTKTALWLSKSLGQIVDKKPDPLKLDEFWPCPRPLFATLTNESLVPIPDFTLYQDQANTLDVLADRIDGLVKALQVKGVYDSSVPELARIFTEGENGTLMPVKNWAAFVEKQGLKGAIDLVDLEPIFSAIEKCYAGIEEQKKQIYEITGLADIIRGSSDPQETATAQKMKGNFGSMRLRAMQSDVAQFATEILRIKAQIICGQFDPQTIADIGGASTLSPQDQQYIGPALQMLKNSTLRDFRVEIAADSMIYMDELQEKEDRMEMLKAVGDYLRNSLPIAQASPQMQPMLMELLKFGVTGFRVGKTIEGVFDETTDKLKQAAANPQPQQNPEMAKVQGQLQLQQAKDQGAMQVAQQKAQASIQVEQSKQAAQAAQAQQENQMEAQRAQMQMEFEAKLEAQKAAFQMQLEQQKMQLEAQFRASQPPPARVQ